MSNFIFSANIVFPIFFLIILGYILQKRNVMTPEFRSKATKLVFYYALPCTLFKSVAGADMKAGFRGDYILYLIISSLLMFFMAWGLTVLLIKDKSQISATVHGAFRGNFAYVGLAILQNLMGTANLTAAVMVIAFVVPMYNVLAIVVLAHYDPSGKKPSVKDQIITIIKNPLIIAILIGIPFSLLNITLPVMIDKTVNYLSQISTPLALLLIGANLQPQTFTKKPQGIILGTLIKTVIAPALFTVLAIPFGFTGEMIATIFVMHGTPSAVNSFIMTEQMGGDSELGAGIVMATSLFSVVSMTIGIFLLKIFNLV